MTNKPDYIHQLTELNKTYTGKELERALGVSIRSVQKYLKEGTKPSTETIRTIREVYAKHQNGEDINNIEEPKTDGFRDKYVALLENNLKEKETLLQDMQKRMIAIEEELKRVTSNLAKAQVNQVVMATSQDAYQEFWLSRQPPKGMTAEKAKSEVAKRAKQLLDLLEKGGLGT